MNLRSIHHFEDEPEFVKWIPGALLNYYWRHHPSWIENEASFTEEDEHLTSFSLRVNGTEWRIQYRLYTDLEDFNTRFKGEQNDVALIDLMNAGEYPGVEVYQTAIAALGSESVYFLTAFPGAVKEKVQLSDDYVFPKPVDVAELVSLLIRKLAVQ